MMSFLKFVAIGLCGGILGGMGMGGGTLTIPLLLACGMGQHMAQSINLFAFIPTAILALYLHKKNHLLQSKGMSKIIIPALLTSLFAAILANFVAGHALEKFYGVFLLFLAVLQVIDYLKQ